jgi:putative ATPase
MAEQYGYGKGYQYSHNYEGGISPDQDYLGVDRTYYTPTDRGYEKHIAAYLEWAAKLRQDAKAGAAPSTAEGPDPSAQNQPAQDA